MAKVLLIASALPLLAAAQGINQSTVFSWYTLQTSGPPSETGSELYSWCGAGPPYCDMLCNESVNECGGIAATYCTEQVVLSGNSSACITVRENPKLNGGTWVATDARELPAVEPVTGGDWLYWASVVYDGSVGPFGDARYPGADPPISNVTVHAFYELKNSGTPWNVSAGIQRTFCAEEDKCDAACDGTQRGCVADATAWCETPASPCAVVYYNEKLGKAVAANAAGLPPTNGEPGDYRFFIDVPHAADVGPPPDLSSF